MIAELVAFYDDMLVVGDLTENYIQHYLKLNVSRMDAVRVGKMLEKTRSIAITKPETYLELAVASRELNLFSEAAAMILKSMLISGGYGWLSGLKSLAGLEFAAFNLPRCRHSRLFNLQLLELGITYRRMGDTAGADRAFRKIIKNSPDYAYAHFLLNDFDRSIELMAGELNESNYPWNNASIVEAIYHCLKETKNKQRRDRYREWGIHYARSISDEFGIFSYKYLKYIPKNLFLNIINDNDPERK
jgi:tetratricopeptide (TPR) repeat protein